ncbi:hypothetical protein [Blastococcus saxobsidens]|uniref:Uncharacterized protein n=1 Tax=Blastococcus saxobsidens (strain DD2) TaxID=1146883 RepID=H6RS81_BLASD|nr:hypothetical protein [Blastococcus saxobsidens]CCG04275.1 Putative uncharacterized protein [Blastococcus saxobsidens DD2]
MRITCRATVPATESQIITQVQEVLDRRGSMAHAPVSVAVTDSVALGIAGFFVSRTDSGQVLERFFRGGEVDSAELLEAVTFEQGYASAEQHAALYCLTGWVHARVHERRAA